MEFEGLSMLNKLMEFLNYDVRKGRLILNTPINVVFFPFKTRTNERPKFREGFNGVVGEVVRQCFSMSPLTNYDEFIKYAISNVKIMTNENEFIEVLNEPVLRDIRYIQNPKTLAFLKLANKEEGIIGEKSIATYINQTLFLNNLTLKSFLEESSIKKGNVITRLQIDYLSHESLENSDFEKSNFYLYTDIIDKFAIDLKRLTSNTQAFLKYFELFLNYYYFFYISQLSMNLSTWSSAGTRHKNLFYFADWESAGKNREAYKSGFNYLRDISKDIYSYINATEHINILFKETCCTLEDIVNRKDSIEILSPSISAFKKWIEMFCTSKSIHIQPIEEVNDLETLFKIYVSALNKSFEETPGTSSRYSKSIEESCKRYFVKNRGSLGNCLNISHDFLMLLVYLSTEKRTNLVDLFYEFENRGIYLDKYSKEEIVDYLTKLNFIDKKSDSGEAQYVKSVL